MYKITTFPDLSMKNCTIYLYVALLSTLCMRKHCFVSGLGTSATTSYIKPQRQVHVRAKIQSYYNECEKKDNKLGCYPEADSPCIATRSCPYLVTWRYVPGSTQIAFELINSRLTDKAEKRQCDQTPNAPKTHYIAIGFSINLPKKHPKIAIVECSIEPNVNGTATKNVGFAWSSNTEYKRWNYECKDTTITGKLTRCNVNLDDKAILCRFQMERRLVMMHEIFNFDDHHFYLHMISGCDIADIKKSFLHGGNFVPGDSVVSFKKLKDNTDEEFRSIFALWHGCLMLIAWTFLVPNGVFLARYFKESFVELSIFKYRLWFAGHIIIMIIAFLITLGAIGCILQDRAAADFAWPTEKSTLLHFNLGLVASLLLVGQMCIGGIRCQGRKVRRSFGAVHLLIGCVCYIVSIVCIALSHTLGMPCNITLYTVGSVVTTFLCHVAMTIHFYLLDKQFGLFIKRALYPFPIPPVTYNELPGTKIRMTIFVIHFSASLFIAVVAMSDYLTYKGARKRWC